MIIYRAYGPTLERYHNISNDTNMPNSITVLWGLIILYNIMIRIDCFELDSSTVS